MAPAMSPSLNPSAFPMPIRATPIVAMVVQELPIISETRAQMMQAAARKIFGWMTRMPQQMSVGTTPLIVQVPDTAPIRKRMRMALPTSAMCPLMASSNFSQGIWKKRIDSQMQTPAEKSRTTWLAPRMASLPKMLIFSASRATSTISGIREMQVCCHFFWSMFRSFWGLAGKLVIIFLFLCL